MIDQPDSILIRYGELALKDSNRGLFESQLQSNLERRLDGLHYDQITRFQGGMKVKLHEDSPTDSILKRLKTVPGVQWFAPGFTTTRDPETIGARALQSIDASSPASTETFAVRTQRSDKSLQMDSMDYDREIGRIILENTGLEVDLDNPDITISVHLLFSESFVFMEPHDGPAGLPVESSGDVLTLLSGGIDSPVAAIQIMKRGCRTDFLHYYPYSSAEKALKTKIGSLISILGRYTTKGKLHLAPYHEYDLRKAPVSERKEIILFRRHMMRVAETLSHRDDLDALVTGESVGQVASQTLENIRSIQRATNSTILRPLIGLDKDEIIDRAKRYGTYPLSIEEYQDCCSIQNSRVDTRTNPDELRSIEEEHNLHEADRAVLNSMTTVPFDTNGLTGGNDTAQPVERSGKRSN
ncbi:MAG: tRNA uracil 4-sulfurtransferase ThiI [bacterium]